MVLNKIFIPMIVLVQLQTSSAFRVCENPWKENLGLSGSKEDFQNLLQIQRNFLSQNFTIKSRMLNGTTFTSGTGIKRALYRFRFSYYLFCLTEGAIKVDMEKCTESPECSIYTVIDKKRENSMILCITVNDTQSCYALTCSCQKSRKKRGVNSHVNLDPKEKPILEETHIPAQCNISTLSYSAYPNASIGHFDDTTTCDRNVTEKDRNTWLNILTFLSGGVAGSIIGSFVICVCFKRKSFKNIPRVNSLYTQGSLSNANENQIQSEYDNPVFSEIPVYLQVLETSSKDSSQAVTIQKSPYKDQSLSSLDVETNINNVNYQRNISVQKKNVVSSRGKLSNSACITMSRQQNNTCVSEPYSDDYLIPAYQTGFLTRNVDPATGCNKYHSLEDILLVKNEENGDKTPIQCSAKALYHVLNAEIETSFTEEVEDHSLVTDNPCLFSNNDKSSLCTTNPRNTADRVCTDRKTLRT